jgi:hypothetical protein
MQTSDELFVVPGLLSLEATAHGANVDITLEEARSSGYSPGITMTAIKVQERNMREANLVMLHTSLHFHLNKRSGVAMPASVVTALDGIREHAASTRAFLTNPRSDMKSLKKRCQTTPRLGDLLHKLRHALLQH